MSAPSLTYFDIRGLAELPRLLLAAAGVKFTDDRIPFSRNEDGTFNRGDWDERKKDSTKFPYNQVPVLNVEGTPIPQSNAIVRYIARAHGLEGSNAIEAALIDAAYESLLDIRKNFFTARGDAAKTAAFWAGFVESFAALDRNVKGNGFWIGSKISYADIALYYTLFVMGAENKEIVDKTLATYPKIQAIVSAVEKDDKIAAYVAARKVTPM